MLKGEVKKDVTRDGFNVVQVKLTHVPTGTFAWKDGVNMSEAKAEWEVRDTLEQAVRAARPEFVVDHPAESDFADEARDERRRWLEKDGQWLPHEVKQQIEALDLSVLGAQQQASTLYLAHQIKALGALLVPCIRGFKDGDAIDVFVRNDTITVDGSVTAYDPR